MTIFQRIRSPFVEAGADEGARMQPRARHVGDALQDRREELGLDLDEIGAMLRIRPAYLAALEQGRYDDLPGPAYAIGFIRAYADFLGLDAEQVLARFKGEAADITARPDLALPMPLGERSLPRGAVVLVALILALCGYGVWYYWSTDNRNRPERVAAVPAALKPPAAPVLVTPPPVQQLAPAPAAGPAPNAPPPATPAPSAAPSPPAPSPVSTAAPPAAAPLAAPPNPAAKPPSAAASPPAAAGPPPAAPSPAPAPAKPVLAAAPTQPPVAPPAPGPAPTAASKVSIRALADCWIQIRAPDQSIVFSRVLKSGEVYAVPTRSGLSLRTGNAGVLEITVDGKTVPPIGSIGTLRRDVQLDPAQLAAGTAVHG